MAAVTHHDVALSTTLIFGAVLVGLILCLALEEKLHAKKSLIAGVFAVISLLLGGAFGLLPFGPIITPFGESIAMPVYIPAVDWGVIAIIVGSSLFVDVTSRSGLFTWIAVKLTKSSGGDLRKLLINYGLMTVTFSAVLNNVTAMIIVGSLTAVSLDRLGRRDKLLAFLLAEGLLTNVGGLLTLISSVPNIIVGTTAGISFGKFLWVSAPYVAVATAATLALAARWFGIHGLKDDEREAAAAAVAAFDENDGIPSRGFFRFGAVMTALFILTIAGTSVLPVVSELGMGFVALAFAAVMLVRFRSEVDTFYRAIDWDLIGFFVALFVVINVAEHARVLAVLGEGLFWLVGFGDVVGTAALLVASAAFSSVTDNIPLAAMLAKILGGAGTDPTSPLWWAVVFGANLGGNITPIGSASTLVAVTVIHQQGIELGFTRFVRVAAPFAVLQLVLAVGYVLLFLS